MALSASMVTPAFAQGSSTSADVTVTAGTASSADLACMSAAINARETASINARTTFNASISAALTARQSALVAAYGIADNEDRYAAVTAAWDAYFKATADARATFKSSVKTANETFVSASANCHIDSDFTFVHHDKDGKKGNHGLHLGWLKNGKHKGTR